MNPGLDTRIPDRIYIFLNFPKFKGLLKETKPKIAPQAKFFQIKGNEGMEGKISAAGEKIWIDHPFIILSRKFFEKQKGDPFFYTGGFDPDLD